jgi:type IV secretion system protein VirB9
MNDLFRKSVLPVIMLACPLSTAGCATQGKPPPAISLDEPVQAQPLPEAAEAGGGGRRARGAAACRRR